jgi:hypothetical protein
MNTLQRCIIECLHCPFHRNCPWPCLHAIRIPHPAHHLCQLCGVGGVHAIPPGRFQRRERYVGEYTLSSRQCHNIIYFAMHYDLYIDPSASYLLPPSIPISNRNLRSFVIWRRELHIWASDFYGKLYGVYSRILTNSLLSPWPSRILNDVNY